MEDRFDDGALRFQCPSEIEDVSLHNRNLEDHFLFLAVEHIVFDGVEIARDMVEARKARIHE